MPLTFSTENSKKFFCKRKLGLNDRNEISIAVLLITNWRIDQDEHIITVKHFIGKF